MIPIGRCGIEQQRSCLGYMGRLTPYYCSMPFSSLWGEGFFFCGRGLRQEPMTQRGPSTQHLRPLVPKTIQCFETRGGPACKSGMTQVSKPRSYGSTYRIYAGMQESCHQQQSQIWGTWTIGFMEQSQATGRLHRPLRTAT